MFPGLIPGQTVRGRGPHPPLPVGDITLQRPAAATQAEAPRAATYRVVVEAVVVATLAAVVVEAAEAAMPAAAVEHQQAEAITNSNSA
jgi:hypothetical protein